MKKRYFPIYLKSGSSMVERYLSIIKNGNFIIFSFWKKNEVNMSFLYFISDYLKKVDQRCELRHKIDKFSQQQIFYNVTMQTINLFDNIKYLKTLNYIYILNFFEQIQNFKNQAVLPFYDLELITHKESILIKCMSGRMITIFQPKNKKMDLLDEFDKLNNLYMLT